jgi:lysozyme
MGIDVSHHQANVNWDRVVATGLYHFAYVRASFGRSNDRKFQANWRAAREAGLTCGAYHYWLPQIAGQAQAETFIQQLGFLQRGDLPPVLDVEEGDYSDFSGLTQSDLEDNIQEYLDTVEAKFGIAPMIYTGAEFWKKANRLNKSTKFSNYLLWISDWDRGIEPTLPGGWPTWEFWQLTDSGSVDGIATPVDIDIFNGDLETLWQMARRQPASTPA